MKRLLILACAFLLMAADADGPRALAATTSAQTRLVEGVVRDERGAPVSGAEVTLTTGAETVARTTTDAEGRFSLSAGAAREGTLSVRAGGFEPFTRAWSEGEGSVDRTNTGDAGAASALEIVLAPARVVERVTVTATRTPTRLGETAASVVVLGADELNATAAATLDDALRQVPGFQLFRRAGSRTANPTSQGVSLRGTGASGASRALVLVDGIPINDPFGGWVYWGRVPREGLSRVEVLRGGFSHLYGSGALGGVVNLLTRPAADPALALELSYGNQSTPDASLFAGGRRGAWGATLAAEIFKTDGYITVDERERGRVDTPAASRHAATELTLERVTDNAGRVFARISYFGEARENGTPLQTNRTHTRSFAAGGDWQRAGAGSFTLRLYGGTQLFDQNFTAVSPDRNTETLTRVQRVPSQVAGLTAQWSRVFGGAHTLVAGFDAREVRGASDEIVYAQGRASSLVGAGGRERTVGAFLETIFRATPRLFLTGGLRFDRWREYAALSATRPLTQSAAMPSVTRFPDRDETAFSPQLAALYKPSEALSFSASFYRAFRAPTLNELYRSFRVGDVLTLANERLRAERLTGGETAASLKTFGRLELRGTLFWAEMTRPVANVTTSVTPTLITRRRENLGRTRSRGLELEAEARLNSRLSVSGGYLFADARVLSFPANRSLEGLRIPQVARHQFTFQLRYTNPSLADFSLQGRAGGRQFDDDQNRLPLGSYFTLDALASRPLTRHLSAFIAAENLFNQRYATGRTPVTTVGPPLLLRAGLRLRLGSR